VSIASEPQVDAPLLTWRVPECAFSIEYSPAVVEEIRQIVMEAFFSLPHGGAEVGGVLYGSSESGHVRILAFRPLPCEHAFGPSFVLSEKDHAALRELLGAGSVELKAQGLMPAGWYHSHTRSQIFLSTQDTEIHNRYFPNALQVALVVRPHPMRPMRAGFFFRGTDGSIHAESSYGEFEVRPHASGPVEIAPMPAEPAIPERKLTDSGNPPRPVPAEPPPEVSLPRSGPEPRIPSFLAVPPPPKHSWQWLGWTLLLLALGASAFALRYMWMPLLVHDPAPASASLMAFDLDGQLQIHWDRATEPVRTATGGILEITDGDHKTVVALDGKRLQGGTFSYVRQTPRVDVRLALDRPNGVKFEEFTSFLGQAPPVKQGNTQAADDDTARLRKELQDQAERTRKLERAIKDMQAQILSEQESQKRTAAGKRSAR
jgi:hypothetical protein